MVYVSPHNHDDDTTRICRVCGERKPFEQFFFTNKKNARRRICKQCVKEQRAVRHEAAPEIRAARGRRALLKRYGLTEASWEALWLWQGGRCAICFEHLGAPHIDHCHTLGHVRGLLCNKCNTGLGKFNDDPILLARAVDYLK